MEARGREYAPQMRAYADALARIGGEPVARASLVFLGPHRILPVRSIQSAHLPERSSGARPDSYNGGP